MTGQKKKKKKNPKLQTNPQAKQTGITLILTFNTQTK